MFVCKLFGHKLVVTSHLPVIFVFDDNVSLYAGTAGFCSRCFLEWKDTADAIPPIEGEGFPKRHYIYGRLKS